MKSAFDITKELCSISTYEGWDVPREKSKIDTPRIEFIESFLKEHNIQHYSMVYDHNDGYIKNVYAPFILNPRLETILITAHHDVLNSSSMNFNDNTSSLALLLNWCRKFEFDKNIFVAFTDNEERGMGGIQKVFDDVDEHLKFYMHIDVDTCGIGDTIIYKEYNSEAEKDFIINNIRDNYQGDMKLQSYNVPYNQAMASNTMYDVDSICISRANVEDNGYVDTSHWTKIHSIHDTYSPFYKEEFDKFEHSFYKLIQNIKC